MKNGTEKKHLSARQVEGMAALLAHDSVSGASKASGIPVRTFTRWKGEELFSAELVAAQSFTIKRVSSALARQGVKAVDVLAHEMGDAASTSQARIRASVAILDSLRQFFELGDISDRLTKIEENNYA